MAQKLRSWRVLSCTVAVLATIALIIACGNGTMVDVNSGDIGNNVIVAEGILESEMEDIVIATLASSSSKEESSSSTDEGNGDDKSSSSEDSPTPSSSSSNNEIIPSSSSEAQNQYTLTCTMLKTTIDPGMYGDNSKLSEIFRVECKDNRDGTLVPIETYEDILWSGNVGSSSSKDGIWDYAVIAGTRFSNIKINVYEYADGCKKMPASCPGTLTVNGTPPPPPPSSSSIVVTPSSSSRAISSSGNGNTQSSSSRANSSSSRANSSSSSRANSSSGGTQSSSSAGNTGEYCYYGPGNCYKMPTNDNCASGVLVSSCDSPTVMYCDYGVCTNGSGWNCTNGGCYVKPASGCSGAGFKEVNKCPDDHLPPCGKDPSLPECK